MQGSLGAIERPQDLLEIEELKVEFDTPQGVIRAADDVSFSVQENEVVGVVGESGSGKSVTSQAILRLLPTPPARVVRGRALYQGQDLLKMSDKIIRRLRGRDIGLVAQEPYAALNPLLTVGRQIREAIEAHDPKATAAETRRRAIELLESVQVPNAAARLGDYPHQFSGGMAQRVAIAIAIANGPRLLIADEPTTALDVTVQAQVLRTLRSAQKETGAAMILITHDMAVIAEFAHRLVVMYAGRVVETGPVRELFRNPAHPYTAGLLDSIPRLDTRIRRLRPIQGQPPALQLLPQGCPFQPRCDYGRGRTECVEIRPTLHASGAGRLSACHFHESFLADSAAHQRSAN